MSETTLAGTGTFRSRLKKILGVMIPILITQLCITGMSLFDTVMSGHAGTVQLAGVAIGTNVWMPVFTGLNGILQALTPIVANYRGAREYHKISGAVVSGLALACALALTVIGAGSQLLPRILDTMSLAPEVRTVAFRYLGLRGLGYPAPVLCQHPPVLCGYPGLHPGDHAAVPADHAGECRNELHLHLRAKLGAPALGGPGGGVGTAITCWLLCFPFPAGAALKVFRDFHVFRISGFSFSHVREHLRIGIPMGLAIFLETSFFGVECLLVSRFGTIAVAANQAAMSFCNMLYMVPPELFPVTDHHRGSLCGSPGFCPGQGLCGYRPAVQHPDRGLFRLCPVPGRGLIARLYTEDPNLMEPIMHFLTFAVAFQFFDSTAAPIQGVLRGYKDVKATFYSAWPPIGALPCLWPVPGPRSPQGPGRLLAGAHYGNLLLRCFPDLRLRYMEKKKERLSEVPLFCQRSMVSGC